MHFPPVRRPLLFSTAMAAAREIVILSSSPPRTIPDSDIIVTPPCLRERVSASPPSLELPSLPDLLKSRPNGLKSGSHAAEIPNGATMGFGSVASLLKERQISLGEDDNEDLPEVPVEKKSPPKRIKGVRKPRTTAPVDDDTAESEKFAMQEENKDGTKATKKDKAPKSRQPRTKKARALEAVATEGMEIANDGSKDLADANRESGAVRALKKRRAKSKAQVSDPLSAQVDALSTKDVLATTEPAVAVDGVPHGNEVAKPNRSVGRPKKAKSDEAVEAKPAGAPRSRQKRTASDGQQQVKRAPKARKATSAVSEHFSRETSREIGAEQVPDNPKNKPIDGPLDLDHATERRRSWTPLKDTTSNAPIEIIDSPSESLVSSGQRANQNQFASLLGGFGYQKSPPGGANVEPRAETGEAFTKRRKLEMIPNHVPTADNTKKKPESVPEKPAKEKIPPKKKPKTITELATAAYRAPPAETAMQVDARVSEFFAPRHSDPPSEKPTEAGSAPPDKPKRARQKSQSKASAEKARKTTEKAKKQAKLAANKLLSPGAALLKYNNQEVLFGTSSQLVREESPNFVRQIQQALKESEAASIEATGPEPLHSRPVAEGEESSSLGKRKGLWTAAARNLVGESFDVYDPAAEETQTAGDDPCPPFSEDIANGEAHPSAQPQDPSSSFVDIDEYGGLTKRCSETSATEMNVDLPAQSHPRPSAGPPVVQKQSPLSSTANALSHTAPRKPTIAGQKSLSPKQLTGARAMSTSTFEKALVAGPTTGGSTKSRKARKTPASSSTTRKGSKAPQKFPQGLINMPNMLPEKTHFPQSRKLSLVATPSELPQGLITPSKTAGRKKARRNEGWVHIDEIEDPEEEVTPSPPRRRKVPSESPKLQLSVPGREENTKPIPAATRAALSKRVSSVPSDEQLAEVFPMITDAIKADPPSVQPGTPTWHEQILLYDPVIVEDLSEWLNGRGVRILMEVAVKEKKTKRKIGRKAKADPPDEAKSGDEATDAQSEKFEVKEVPLQPWIVQRWCEEHSVCCIWKDNEQKRKGWKARTG
ncbi:hypothetical protein IWZ03DRAFT_247948 [Phyllosticta citriasiana]|uniref:Structure-specific endonuclease subunit SLX4 n=1 Tax=Phyllosticta citriasiana TaxID=595635 RepID=A0ABR1KIR8_9PEZI